MAERFMRRSRRYLVSPLTVVLVMMLVAVAPDQAYRPQAAQAGQTAPGAGRSLSPVPASQSSCPSTSSRCRTAWKSRCGPPRRSCFNPTNIDIDRDGRIWVAEGVRYRSHHARQPEGDRIVVLQDTDGDGKADSTHTFVQEPALIAPLGVSVIDNKIVVAQPPDLIVYTDVDRNLKFDPAVDKREVLLTGFQGATTTTRCIRSRWVPTVSRFQSGKCGRCSPTSRARPSGSSAPTPGPGGPVQEPAQSGRVCGQAQRRRARVCRRIHGAHESGRDQRGDHRLELPQQLRAVGHVARRRLPERQRRSARGPRHWVMEYANFGFSSNDGQRTWKPTAGPARRPVAEWRQDDPGMTPAGDVYGGGSPTGNVFYENGAMGPSSDGTFFAAEPGRNEIFSYQPVPQGAGFASRSQDLHDLERQAAVCRVGFHRRQRDGQGRDRDPVPAVRRRRRSRGALYVSDWIDPRVGGHQDLDETGPGRSTASPRKGSSRKCRPSTRRR